MNSRRHAFLRISALLVGTIALGAVVGYLVGRVMLQRAAESDLLRYADDLVKHSEAYGEEISSIFAAARASHLPFCSEDDIFRLRGLAFNSQIVKDVGRIRDGKLYCSGTLGRLPQPWAMPPVDFLTPHGKKVHANVPLAIAAGGRAAILEVDGVDVVLGPSAFDGWGRPPMGYMVALVNPERQQVAQVFGAPVGLTSQWILSGRQRRNAGTLYRARCSEAYAFCVVTTLAMAEIPRGDPELLLGYTGLGALAGFGIGLGAAAFRRRSSSLIVQLRRALRAENLTLAYQPVIDLETHRMVGAEALVRWTNELGIPVPPDVFVSLAEQGGFVGELTSLVLERVVAELGGLLRGPHEFRVTVNVSAADLASPDFHALLERLVFENRIPASRLGLELTERTAANHAVALDAIQRLRARGHRVYIDDFGTGYSSLAYLHELDVDAIKVDRSFTRTINTDAVIASILPQILNMAETLDLAVTVEGVEIAEQARYLERSGHHVCGQGWYFSKPLPAEGLLALLAEGGIWPHSEGSMEALASRSSSTPTAIPPQAVS
jgi:sensor c-di-GMP phosphodiesterase-like protein